MMQRQRVLLYLIHSLQAKGCYTKTNVDKLLFLLSKEYKMDESIPFYSFYPYRFGPFSELFYYDMRKLANEGYLAEEMPSGNAISEMDKLDGSLKSRVDAVCERFEKKDVTGYVYSNFPDYTVKSQLRKKEDKNMEPGLFSIGYEGRNIDVFLDVLIHNDIRLLVDVRHNPFSMQFYYVKNKLKQYLKKVGIEYVHLPELGVEGDLRKNLQTQEDYEELFEFYRKNIINRDKLEKLVQICNGKRAALLCMEKEHQRCHRRVISSELEKLGLTVTHL